MQPCENFEELLNSMVPMSSFLTLPLQDTYVWPLPGINRADLIRCSFEETVKISMEAAAVGKRMTSPFGTSPLCNLALL